MKNSRFTYIFGVIPLLFCLSTQADITNGLALYLRLDETTGLAAVDATTNGHNATLINFPGDDSQWVSGRTNGACYFNNGFVGNQYAIIDDSTNGLNFATQPNPTITLAAWVRGALGATQTNGCGIICHGFGGGGEQYALDMFQNSYRFFVRDAAGVASTIQLTPAPSNSVSGLWQHIVGVFDSTQAVTTNRMKLYINGILTGQVAGPTTLLATTHDVSIGAREGSSVAGYNLPFTGKMDDARIYNRALSQADVTELYLAAGLFAPEVLLQPVGATAYVGDPVGLTVVSDGSVPLTYQWKKDGVNIPGATTNTLTFASVQLTNAGTYTVAISNSVGFAISSNAVVTVTDPPPDLAAGLQVHLQMNETNGLVATDSTTNGHNANLIGFPNDDSQWLPGRIAGGLNQTNGQYSTIDDSTGALDFATNPAPAFTVALWVRGLPGVQINDAGVIAKGFGNGGEQFAIDVHNGVYRFFLRNGASQAGFDLNSTATVDGTWQHLVAVYNHTNAQKFYINGQLVASRLSGPATLFDNLHEISLGARESGNGTGYNRPYAGILDDVRIYNRALTPTEVQNLYAAAGVAAPTFVLQPQSANLLTLDNYTFTSVVDGTVPITYQWRKDGTNIPNATNATLTLNVLQTTNAGVYSVAVTNAGGFAISSNAVLTVTELPPNDITTGLTVWWALDETNGTTVGDSSIYATNTAALYNFQFAGTDAQWGPGRVGGALHFNAPGTEELGVNNQVIRDDYVYSDQPIRFPYNSNTFTFAFWIKLDRTLALTDHGLNPRIFAWPSSPTAGTAFGYWRRQGGNNPAFGPVEPQRSPVPDMAWKHFAITWDRAANTYTLFVNGLYATNFTSTARAVTVFSGARWLLNHSENLTSAADGLAGFYDDVRIYNRILTTNQVSALFASAGAHWAFDTQPQSATVNERDSVTLTAAASSSTPGPIAYQWRKGGTNIAGATSSIFTLAAVGLSEAGTYSAVASNSLGTITSSDAVITITPIIGDFTNDLTAYWTFDETSGLAAADSSGNGYNASLLNFANDNSQWVPGIRGGALRLNVTSPLTVGNNHTNVVITDTGINFTNSDNFSFSFWLKRDPGLQGSNPRIISPATIHWVLWRPVETSGVNGLNGVGLFQPANSPQPISNTWVHFVCVVDRPANVYSLYVNGVRAIYRGLGLSGPGGTVSAAKAVPAGVQWVIGHAENVSSQVDGFRGSIDDMRIYNRQLNLKDVEALYQSYNQSPTLQVQSDGSKVTLSWPAWATGFKLQSSPVVSGGPWTDVTDTPTVTAFTARVVRDVISGNTFYRLSRQIP